FIKALAANKDIISSNDYKSGFGKDSFSFDVNVGEDIYKPTHKGKSPVACMDRVVGLDLIDSRTGQTNHSELTVPIGGVVETKEKLIGNADSSDFAILESMNLGDKDIIDQINEEYVKKGLNISKDAKDDPDALNQAKQNLLFMEETTGGAVPQVDPVKGYRIGDIVAVSANFIEKGECDADFMEALVYNWTVDDLLDENRSGVGRKTFEIAMTNMPVSLNEGGDASSHILKLEVINPKTDTLFARDISDFRVINSYIDMSVPNGANKPTSQASPGDSETADYILGAGQKIEVVATPRYFRPASRYTYTWRRNNEIIAESTETALVPATVEFTKDDVNARETLTLDISSDGDESKETARQHASKTIVFDVKQAEDSTLNNVGGAIMNAVPPYFRNIFNVALALGGFVIVAIMALMFYKGKETGK
ncbi:hypothetical protein KKC60_01655, partial [Patescibacteria group bacterium]|nr:hypothetical protein [Patescibacteria group bacterium]